MFKQIADMFEQNNKLFVHIVKKHVHYGAP